MRANIILDRYITRGEVRFHCKIFRLKDEGNVPFTDVRQYEWYYQDIAKVYNSVFSGYNDNIF